MYWALVVQGNIYYVVVFTFENIVFKTRKVSVDLYFA